MFCTSGSVASGADRTNPRSGEDRLHSLPGARTGEGDTVGLGGRARPRTDDEKLTTQRRRNRERLGRGAAQLGTVLAVRVHPERVPELFLVRVHGCTASRGLVNAPLAGSGTDENERERTRTNETDR